MNRFTAFVHVASPARAGGVFKVDVDAGVVCGFGTGGSCGSIISVPQRKQFLGMSWDVFLSAATMCGSGLVGLAIVWFQPIKFKFTALLWALAFTITGVLAGFIFGVPRTGIETSINSKDGSIKTSERPHLSTNSNIEQVSDWLTKLLLGAGLVQLQNIPRYVHDAAIYIAKGFDPAIDYTQFAAALIVYFSVDGFLGGYLATRMFYQTALQRIEEAVKL